jgi:hypothetical protein
MIVEYIIIGFLSAIGWWGANHYVIEPYFPEPIVKEKKVEEHKEEKK